MHITYLFMHTIKLLSKINQIKIKHIIIYIYTLLNQIHYIIMSTLQ